MGHNLAGPSLHHMFTQNDFQPYGCMGLCVLPIQHESPTCGSIPETLQTSAFLFVGGLRFRFLEVLIGISDAYVGAYVDAYVSPSYLVWLTRVYGLYILCVYIYTLLHIMIIYVYV